MTEAKNTPQKHDRVKNRNYITKETNFMTKKADFHNQET